MKTLILFLLISLNIFAQSNVILLSGSGATPPVSGFDPSDLSPVLDLRYGVGMTKAPSSGNVTQWTDGTYTFANADTTTAPQDLGDCLYFVTGGTRFLSRNASDNVFDLTEAQDFTIELWAYIGGVGRTFHNRGSAPYWLITMADNSGPKFRLQISDGSNIPIIEADTVTINDGWHHLVVTVDWGVGADIYIDGQLKISEHTAEWTGFSTAGQSEPTYIGRSDNAEGFGRVSDIRLYHSALSSSDVTDLYNFGRSQ